MPRRVAVVGDDPELASGFAAPLAREGFAVDSYVRRDDALSAFTACLPDIVLLDAELDGERDGGLVLCTQLRSQSVSLPIVFLSSRGADIDRISGLRVGADDYLTKDISFDYLVVRLETLLRRFDAVANGGGRNGAAQARSHAPLVMEDDLARAEWRGVRVDLSLAQYLMLRAMVQMAGRIVSHAELMRAAYITVEPNTVVAYVKAIRDAFRASDPEFDCIRTERGLGYRWIP
jgi:two-component system, OmpR family, response regulator